MIIYHKDPIPEGHFIFAKLRSHRFFREAFELRFQVYCRECHFINEVEYSQEYETDEWDKHAVQFGVFKSSSLEDNRMIGSARLILPDCESFPIERLCPDTAMLKMAALNRGKCAEISRFVISRVYKNEIGLESLKRDCREGKSMFSMRKLSPIAAGLSSMIYEECRQRNIEYCFALMEKPMWVLAKLTGLNFEPIGYEVDFYGSVRPYIINVKLHENKMRESFLERSIQGS